MRITPKSIKGIIIICAIALLFTPILDSDRDQISTATTSGNLSVTFLDADQGDSILLCAPSGTTLLVDCGESEIYRQELVPMLEFMGISKLDYVLATHYHSDHIGGIVPLVEDGVAKTLLLPDYQPENSHKKKLLSAAEESNTTVSELSRGDKIDLGDDNLVIEILHPYSGGFDKDNENSNSVVLKITYFKTTLLLTGDIEEDAERILAKNFDLECDILKVAHHGSFSSTCPEFLREANPTHAVIQCGKNNRYGHPHSETLAALEDDDVTIWRTDTDGAVNFLIGESGVKEIKTHFGE